MMRTTQLFSGHGFSGRLSFYGAARSQAAHTHELPAISLILSGTVGEQVGRREALALEGSLGVKPAGVRHSDVYGDMGAVILSVSIEDQSLWSAAVADENWRWCGVHRDRLSELLRLFQCLSAGAAKAEAFFQLMASVAQLSPSKGVPPCWIRKVRERLDDEPRTSLQQLAADAGVHPVYLARAFSSWYGVSPSTYRLRRKVSAAVAYSLTGAASLSVVASEADFTDQSHMCRAVRGVTGRSLSELRRQYQHGSHQITL